MEIIAFDATPLFGASATLIPSVGPLVTRIAPALLELSELAGSVPLLGFMGQYLRGPDHTPGTAPQRVPPQIGKPVRVRTDEQKKRDRTKVLTLDDALGCVEEHCDSWNMMSALMKGGLSAPVSLTVGWSKPGGDFLVEKLDACMRMHVLPQETFRSHKVISHRVKGIKSHGHGGRRAGSGRKKGGHNSR